MDKIPLRDWNSWFAREFEPSVKDIYERVIRSALSIKSPTLGKAWRELGQLYEALGPFEFELYLSSVLDGKKKLIEERGFYPQLLLGDECVDLYEKRRDGILDIWRHPGNRYRDPLFNNIFASESSVAQEAVAQISRLGELNWDSVEAACMGNLHPAWIHSNWEWKDLKEMDDTFPADTFRRIKHFQTTKVKENLKPRLNVERIRASFECSVRLTRRVLSKKDVPEYMNISVQKTVTPEWSPLKETLELLKGRVKRIDKPFLFHS